MSVSACPEGNPGNHSSAQFLQRMIGDMKIRHFSPRTINSYCRHARLFAQFIDKPLTEATPEDIRLFQLHLIEVRKLAWSSFNQAVCSLRFLYRITLPREWGVTMIPYGKKRKYLPSVLSSQEVETLLKCTHNRKHRTLLMVLYATGLRISEATHLQVADIDSQRMQLKVTHGKGNKMRFVPFSPRLLTELREYWRDFQPKTFLFPGQSSNWPLGQSSIQEAIKVSGAQVEDHQTGHSPHPATFLCHSPLGSRSGLIDDQSLAGACELYDHDDLLAHPTASPAIGPQPVGLAARQSDSHLAASGQAAQQSQAKLNVLRRYSHARQGLTPTFARDYETSCVRQC